jgi:hypothetical protein
MMLQIIDLATVIPIDGLADTSIHWQLSQMVHASGFEQALIFAQNASDIQSIDIMADVQDAWKNFIESGQVWALGIGLVLGWILHSFLGS